MRDGTGAARTVLVLGGRSAIGVAIAERLVHDGARTIVLASRPPAAGGPDSDRLLHAGATTVEQVAFDADDLASHAALIDRVVAVHGDLDVVVVAFGVLGDQQQAERDTAAALAVHRTTVLGGVSVLTELSRVLRHQGHGEIVVLSSVAAVRARRANYVYGSAKAGLDAFASGLADALVGSGVHLLVVRPGFVRSPMTAGLPAAPLSTTPSAVAAAVGDALARRAHTVYVPRRLVALTAVLRLLPRPALRRLTR